jgi:hypothetical protein
MDRHEIYARILCAMLSNPEITQSWMDKDLDFIAERAWYITREAWNHITAAR